MSLHAVWTPGYNAQAQFAGPGALLPINSIPWSDVVGLREGFGGRFRMENGKSNWFHFAIPTPVIVNNARAKLLKVFVFYNIDTWAMLKEVTIWDGPQLINRINSLSLTGNHANNIDPSNTFAATNAPVKFGIGVSVRMECAPGLDANILFTSVGADFDI